jgi:hypothetical protein
LVAQRGRQVLKRLLQTGVEILHDELAAERMIAQPVILIEFGNVSVPPPRAVAQDLDAHLEHQRDAIHKRFSHRLGQIVIDYRVQAIHALRELGIDIHNTKLRSATSARPAQRSAHQQGRDAHKSLP